MSILSLRHEDHSDTLCGRFATLVSSYLDRPEEARKAGATIPLENLFRVLQMYRYDAFSDERRSGVLALEGSGEASSFSEDEDNWHLRIESALNDALATTFQGTPKEQAIPQIQSALRWLATDKEAPPPDVRNRAKAFLDRLSSDLK